MDRRRREPLLHVGVKFCARGVERVASVDETRIGAEPPHEIVEPLVALDRLRQRAAGVGHLDEGSELALEILLESNRISISPIEIALHRRIVDTGVEVREVPLWQRAEAGGRPAGGFVGFFCANFCGGTFY